MNLPQYVTVNGTNYATDKLSEEAREQVANLQIVEEEIRHLNNLLGISQTAKNVYVGQLLEAMKSTKVAPASEPSKKPSEAVPKKTRASKKTASAAV